MHHQIESVGAHVCESCLSPGGNEWNVGLGNSFTASANIDSGVHKSESRASCDGAICKQRACCQMCSEERC